MYSTQKSVLQLVALMKAHHIHHVVLCPGSRNAPIVETFATCPDFTCYSIVDERSAAFFALGIAQFHREVVAVCCTSGSALLNMAPAVAEAFYQELPLLVISADRPEAWIGQKDGQTLPQPSAFGTLVKKAVQLPESLDAVSYWYRNRLINESLLALTTHGGGPVHINVPITEPFFDFSETKLPNERVISYLKPEMTCPELAKLWNSASKVMILLGQMNPDPELKRILHQIEQLGGIVVSEYLSNYSSTLGIEESISFHCEWNLITAWAGRKDQEEGVPEPDLLLYCGGHLVSKSVKKYLRTLSSRTTVVQIHPNATLTDTFMNATHIVEMEPQTALESIIEKGKKQDESFRECWKRIVRKVHSEIQTIPPTHSSIYRVKQLMETLPSGCTLHLANSSTVRLAELAELPQEISVYCNRGTSGIEGSLSTAAGYSTAHPGYTYITIGDLSYFYDLNILRHATLFPRLRIILLNNGGGEIFHVLPGMDRASQMKSFIAASHSNRTKGWLEDCGIAHYYVHELNADSENTIKKFLEDQENRPALLELHFDAENDRMAYEQFYHSFRRKKE